MWFGLLKLARKNYDFHMVINADVSILFINKSRQTNVSMKNEHFYR